MKKRGPGRKTKRKPLDRVKSSKSDTGAPTPTSQGAIRQDPPLNRLSTWPFDLDSVENRLLDHYIQRFSREYPTCSGPTNPFLRIFLPLSMQSRTVLDALLALSGVQSWENGNFVFPVAMLQLRQKAIRGCMGLTAKLLPFARAPQDKQEPFSESGLLGAKLLRNVGITRDRNFLLLLTSCVLLLLYEKLAGEGERKGSPHLHFFARVAPSQLVPATTSESVKNAASNPWGEAYQFLSSLFFYNDLVQSTSLGTPALSTYYLENNIPPLQDPTGESSPAACHSSRGRFYFPHLIARIGSGDLMVTDAEIAAWDGRLDWFPSFALFPLATRKMHRQLPVDEPQMVLETRFCGLGSLAVGDLGEDAAISELYRAAAAIYRRQCALRLRTLDARMPDNDDTRMGNLPFWAAQLLEILTPASPFDNALLWPIGIFAKELTSSHQQERDCVTRKLKSLERRFKMKNFCCVREYMLRNWRMKDVGLEYEADAAILFG